MTETWSALAPSRRNRAASGASTLSKRCWRAWRSCSRSGKCLRPPLPGSPSSMRCGQNATAGSQPRFTAATAGIMLIRHRRATAPRRRPGLSHARYGIDSGLPPRPRPRPFAPRPARAGPGSGDLLRAGEGGARSCPSTPCSVNARRIAAFRRPRTASASASTSSSRPYPARGRSGAASSDDPPAHLLAERLREREEAAVEGQHGGVVEDPLPRGPLGAEVEIGPGVRPDPARPRVAGRPGIDPERVRQHDPVVPARAFARDEAEHHVASHRLRVALEGVPRSRSRPG